MGLKIACSLKHVIASLVATRGQGGYALLNLNMTETKRAKTYHFHPKWEEDNFFDYSHLKPACLICNATVGLTKNGSWSGILKQYKRATRRMSCQNPFTCHKSAGFESAACSTAVNLHQNSEPRVTIASYPVSHVLAIHEKPFKDGDIVKDAFLEAADSLAEHFKNKTQIVQAIKEAELFRDTRQCEGMAV